MFTTGYKQAGIRVMSEELTQAVLAHYIIIIGSEIRTHHPSLSFVYYNEISRNKVVVPEGAAGLISDYFYSLSLHLR